MDNFEELNKTEEKKLALNVNVVVSAFNVLRLPEVLRHLTTRFEATPFVITFKRVRPIWGREQEFLEQIHAPFAKVRSIFRELVKGMDSSLSIRFRDFPLCAFPGAEHLDAMLQDFLKRVNIRHNFFDQRKTEDMSPITLMKAAHPFSWMCELCELERYCLFRGIFNLEPISPEGRPVPWQGAVPSDLSQMVHDSERTEAELEAFAAPASKPDQLNVHLLRELQRASPPGQPLPGTTGTWQPLSTGLLLLEDGEHSTQIRVGSPQDDWDEFWPAGQVAICPGGGRSALENTEMRSTIASLTRLLRTLPAHGSTNSDNNVNQLAGFWDVVRSGFAAHGLESATPGPTVCIPRRNEDQLEGLEVRHRLSGSASQETARFLFAPGGQESTANQYEVVFEDGRFSEPSDECFSRLLDGLSRWAGSWNTQLREKLVPRLRRLISRPRWAEHLDEPCLLAAFSNAIVVRLPPENEVRPCRVAPLDDGDTSGFLCSGVRLRPHPDLLASSTGYLWIRAIARAIISLRKEGSWPDEQARDAGPFLRTAWHTFGEALLPTVSRTATLTAGSVNRDKIVLQFCSKAGEEMDLVLRSSETSVQSYKANKDIMLFYATKDKAPLSEGFMGIVDYYANLL